MSTMRLPNTAHTSRPWRIHELTRDFRLEDVWALPTPGGPDDFPGWWAGSPRAGDPSRGLRRGLRALFAIRWKLGELLGWDDPDAGLGSRVPTLRDRLPADLRDAPSGPDFARALHLALPARRRVGGGDRQPDRARGHAPRLGPGRDRRLPRPDGRPGEAERTARDRLHGRDQAVPAPDRVPGDDASDRAGLAGGRRRSDTGTRSVGLRASTHR